MRYAHSMWNLGIPGRAAKDVAHLIVLVVSVVRVPAQEIKPVYPQNAPKAVGPYTPGLVAGNFLYVSGQGARDASGKIPPTFDAQAKQCLENVRAIVETAGLKLENVVYTQVYLADVKNYDAMNKVYGTYFSKNVPARSTIGVARMPTNTPIEISAVAVRDIKLRRAAKVPAARLPGAPVASGVQVGDRFYLGGIVGRNFRDNSVPDEPRAQIELMVARANEVLAAAKLEMRHLASATLYIDPKMPLDTFAEMLEDVIPTETALTIIQTQALPFGAHIELTGIASRDTQRLGHCNAIGDTVYCRARTGTVNEVMKEIGEDLAAAKTNYAHVVASNVYIDNLENFNMMNKTYGSSFSKLPPTRTTVQPLANAPELILAPNTERSVPAGAGPKVQIAVTAIRQVPRR